ncbi:MAG TPA: hypothetical protein VGU74_00460 [Gemmatimonadales bacterium]|nr:hypothetical protein [Gemmatimonadales bacterium]
MTLDPERARELGRRSGLARARLTLEDVERDLPVLDSPQHIREAYAVVRAWAIAGLLPPGTAQAVIKSIDGAVKVLELAVDLGRLRELEGRIKQLERELADARRGAK